MSKPIPADTENPLQPSFVFRLFRAHDLVLLRNSWLRRMDTTSALDYRLAFHLFKSKRIRISNVLFSPGCHSARASSDVVCTGTISTYQYKGRQ